MKLKHTLSIIVGVALALSLPASAATITLSDVVSSEYGNPAVEDLRADMHFVLDSPTLPATLTYTVDNRTDETIAYDISEMYFNVPDNVTDVFNGVTGWEINFLPGGYQANGFGFFDVFLVDGVGGDPHQILPGESKVFALTIEGSGPISESDFITEFSNSPSSMCEAIVAAKFVNGPGDASGYGAAIPEPGTVLLILAGGLGATTVRRWRRKA